MSILLKNLLKFWKVSYIWYIFFWQGKYVSKFANIDLWSSAGWTRQAESEQHMLQTVLQCRSSSLPVLSCTHHQHTLLVSCSQTIQMQHQCIRRSDLAIITEQKTNPGTTTTTTTTTVINCNQWREIKRPILSDFTV